MHLKALVGVQELGLKSLRNRHWHIVGCSARKGDGIIAGFDWVVQDVKSRIYVLD